jgi:hypothetical protein
MKARLDDVALSWPCKLPAVEIKIWYVLVQT